MSRGFGVLAVLAVLLAGASATLRRPGTQVRDGGCCDERDAYCADHRSVQACIPMKNCLKGIDEVPDVWEGECEGLALHQQRSEYVCGHNDCESERQAMCGDRASEAKCRTHFQCTGEGITSEDTTCTSPPSTAEYLGVHCNDVPTPAPERCPDELAAWCDAKTDQSRCEAFNLCAGYPWADCTTVTFEDMAFWCGECESSRKTMCRQVNLAQEGHNDLGSTQDREFFDACIAFFGCRDSLRARVVVGDSDVMCNNPDLEVIGEYCTCNGFVPPWVLALIITGSAAVLMLGTFFGHRWWKAQRAASASASGKSTIEAEHVGADDSGLRRKEGAGEATAGLQGKGSGSGGSSGTRPRRNSAASGGSTSRGNRRRRRDRTADGSEPDSAVL